MKKWLRELVWIRSGLQAVLLLEVLPIANGRRVCSSLEPNQDAQGDWRQARAGGPVPQSDVCLLRLLGTPSLQHKCLSWEDAEHAPGPAAVGEPK